MSPRPTMKVKTFPLSGKSKRSKTTGVSERSSQGKQSGYDRFIARINNH